MKAQKKSKMNPRVKKVEARESYRLELLFENGDSKEFDVSPFLEKGIFRELKNFVRYYLLLGNLYEINCSDG